MKENDFAENAEVTWHTTTTLATALNTLAKQDTTTLAA